MDNTKEQSKPISYVVSLLVLLGITGAGAYQAGYSNCYNEFHTYAKSEDDEVVDPVTYESVRIERRFMRNTIDELLEEREALLAKLEELGGKELTDSLTQVD